MTPTMMLEAAEEEFQKTSGLCFRINTIYDTIIPFFTLLMAPLWD